MKSSMKIYTEPWSCDLVEGKRGKASETRTWGEKMNVLNEKEMNLSTLVIEKAGGMRVDEDAMRRSE